MISIPPERNAQPADRQPLARYLPAAVVVLLCGTLAVPLAQIPFPFIDLYSNFALADTQSWSATLPAAFAAGVEYRPLLTIASKLAYDSIGLGLGTYHAIVLLQFAGILGVLVWMFRADGWGRAVAAVVALLCVTGLHSSRILFNFNPLNAHSSVMLIVLVVGAAAFDARARRMELAWFVVTLGATLALESGLLIVPVLAMLWLADAPGVSRRGVAMALLAVAVYATIRLAFGATVDAGAAYTHSGLGFSAATPERLDATFGRWPWLFWIYNVVASLFTVFLSEPREGTYVFIDSVLHGQTPTWMWLHVLTSAATSVVILGAYLRAGLPDRDRYISAMAVGLILGGSALGFLYTRDRIALPVGVGYAMLLYVALSAVLINRARLPRAVAPVVVAVVATGWIVRDVETWWFLRDLAWEHHREWSVRYEAIRNNRAETDLMRVLQALALERTPADPTAAPPWTFQLLERKFGPSQE